MEQITIKLPKEEKKIIKKASKLLCQGHSTFARACTLREAYKILTENKEVSS